MRHRLVSITAILAALAAPSVVSADSPAAAAPAAAVTAQAADSLQGAPVADLVSRVDIPWSRFQLDNGLTVLVHTDADLGAAYGAIGPMLATGGAPPLVTAARVAGLGVPGALLEVSAVAAVVRD